MVLVTLGPLAAEQGLPCVCVGGVSMAGEEVEGAPKPALGCRLYTWERGVWEREGRSGVPWSAIRLAAKEQPGGHLGTGMGVGGAAE